MGGLGAQFRLVRKSHNISQEALAAAIGVDPSTISKWEREMTAPDLIKFGEWAKALGGEVSIGVSFPDGP